MKKIVFCFTIILFSMGFLFGCTTNDGNETPKTETGIAFGSDGKEVTKIETGIYFGEVLIYYYPVRTFDFSSCTVTDTATMDDKQIQRLLENYNDDPESYPDYKTVEAYEAHLQAYYNTPEQVTSFTRERAEAFIENIASLGIDTWKAEYNNDSYSCGGWHYVTIFFADGTKKATRFYDDYPKNYKDVENAFTEYLGTGIYCTK